MAAADRVVAGAAAVLLGLAYGLCLVSGLRQAEHMASPDERGAVIACYYALAYLGFGAPYLADGLSALPGRRPERAGGQDRCVRRADRDLRGGSRSGWPGMRSACAGPSGVRKVTALSGGRPGIAIPCHDEVTHRFVRND